jgi:exopolysaccharide biosynthesis polyprenyl glycosylphosphotransferase
LIANPRNKAYEETSTALEFHKFNKIEINHASSYLIIKRFFDIVLSLIALLFSIPIIIITGIIVKLESPGPIFFKQERVGIRGEHFYIIKIRSMDVNAEKNGATWAAKNDPRVTRVGRFIRATRIDELPQLWNILKGDMSIVGPRPERPIFTAQFNQEIPGFINRVIVKPGLTGWAQINGGYDLSPSEKLEKDLFYIRNQGLFMDLKIIIKTFFIVFNGNGAR